MIRAFTFGVSLVLVAGLVLAPAPALAVSMAECEAWLCMPGGFPPSECSPAKAAVTARLAAMRPPLPPWSSCAAEFGWDAAVLDYSADHTDECPKGGTPTNGVCRGKTAEDCDFSYSAQKIVTVQVIVDGSTSFAPNRPHTQTTATAGQTDIDPATCPPPPPPPPGEGAGGCPAGHLPYTMNTPSGPVYHCVPNPGFFSVN